MLKLDAKLLKAGWPGLLLSSSLRFAMPRDTLALLQVVVIFLTDVTSTLKLPAHLPGRSL